MTTKTDTEINRAVAEALGMGDCFKYFDPCNNVADAWPIIVENGISLDSPLRNLDKRWQARGNGCYRYDLDPLRAAMLVYLEMMESEK